MSISAFEDERFRELLQREFLPYGRLTTEQIGQLARHYRLMCQWNKRLNLTRIESLEDAVKLHYCESLFAGLQLPSGALRIADVGSGPGFPGFPIAVVRPESQVTLIESNRRKCVFLREASRGAKNIRVLELRAERVTERFDWVVSRAIAPSKVLELGLASRMGLLVGQDDAAGAERVVPLPWGKGRTLGLFHVKHGRIAPTWAE
jgi:16S rRNA (guanine(527)-N(7))-methyltransferase RsmG